VPTPAPKPVQAAVAKKENKTEGTSATAFKLFVGGLAWTTWHEGLKAAFANCHGVVDASVVIDRATSESRGFGFVSFDCEKSMIAAKEQMTGRLVDGRKINCELSEGKKATPRTGSHSGEEPKKRKKRSPARQSARNARRLAKKGKTGE
jgi:RNA recognition motif-containing protein